MKSTNELEILSWNVHYPFFAKDNTYVADTLEQLEQLDVICLQEYVDGASEQTKEWLENNNYVINYLPFASKGDLSQGVMTAVRKGLSAKTVPIILREDEPRRLRPFPNIRGLLATTVQTEHGEVTINNVHLTVPRPHLVDLRKREFTELKEYLNSQNTSSNWLLCGDFNFMPYDSRRKYLTNRYTHFTGSMVNKTWRNHQPYTPIRANLDYLFWREGSIRVAAELLDFNHSDHRPMRATLS